MTVDLYESKKIKNYWGNKDALECCDYQNLFASAKELLKEKNLSAWGGVKSIRGERGSDEWHDNFWVRERIRALTSYNTSWHDRVRVKSRNFLYKNTFDPVYQNAEGSTGYKEAFDMRGDKSAKLLRRVRNPHLDYTGSQITQPLTECAGEGDRFRTYENFLGVQGGKPFTICSEIEAYHILEWREAFKDLYKMVLKNIPKLEKSKPTKIYPHQLNFTKGGKLKQITPFTGAALKAVGLEKNTTRTCKKTFKKIDTILETKDTLNQIEQFVLSQDTLINNPNVCIEFLTDKFNTNKSFMYDVFYDGVEGADIFRYNGYSFKRMYGRHPEWYHTGCASKELSGSRYYDDDCQLTSETEFLGFLNEEPVKVFNFLGIPDYKDEYTEFCSSTCHERCVKMQDEYDNASQDKGYELDMDDLRSKRMYQITSKIKKDFNLNIQSFDYSKNNRMIDFFQESVPQNWFIKEVLNKNKVAVDVSEYQKHIHYPNPSKYNRLTSEKEVELEIVKKWDELDVCKDLELVENQHSMSKGQLDILAKASDGEVLIELKHDNDRSATMQLITYIHSKKMSGVKIKEGWLIVGNITPRILYPILEHNEYNPIKIKLFQWDFNSEFNKLSGRGKGFGLYEYMAPVDIYKKGLLSADE